MDAELVSYTMDGGSLVITRRPEPTKYLTYSGGAAATAPAAGGTATFGVTVDKRNSGQPLSFIPQHSYGSDDASVQQFMQLFASLTNGERPYGDSAGR